MKREQNLLNSETSTGSDIKKQKEWYLKIENDLHSLSDYSSNKWKIVEF